MGYLSKGNRIQIHMAFRFLTIRSLMFQNSLDLDVLLPT